MHITVRCFAGCKDVVGAASLKIHLPDGATVGAALEQLIATYPGLDRYRKSLLLAVNKDYASRERILMDGDELACIPPVSGGEQYGMRNAECGMRNEKL